MSSDASPHFDCEVELEPRECPLDYCKVECSQQYNGTAYCKPTDTSPSACFCGYKSLCPGDPKDVCCWGTESLVSRPSVLVMMKIKESLFRWLCFYHGTELFWFSMSNLYKKLQKGLLKGSHENTIEALQNVQEISQYVLQNEMTVAFPIPNPIFVCWLTSVTSFFLGQLAIRIQLLLLLSVLEMVGRIDEEWTTIGPDKCISHTYEFLMRGNI